MKTSIQIALITFILLNNSFALGQNKIKDSDTTFFNFSINRIPLEDCILPNGGYLNSNVKDGVYKIIVSEPYDDKPSNIRWIIQVKNGHINGMYKEFDSNGAILKKGFVEYSDTDSNYISTGKWSFYSNGDKYKRINYRKKNKKVICCEQGLFTIEKMI